MDRREHGTPPPTDTVKKLLPFLLAGCLAGGAGFLAYRYLASPSDQVTPAPEVALSSLEGATVRLSAFRGQLVLVNFWATWCAPCLKEIPLLVDAQTRYGARGLQILGPAMDDPEQVRTMLPRLKIQYPILIGETEIPKAMDALGDTLGALPYSVLISPDGYVIKRKHGEFEAEELDRLIEANLPKT